MAPSLAPIAFFAYKRPDLAKNALVSLRECRLAAQSTLRIYCDGPKTAADAAATEEVRRVARSQSGFAKVEIVERTENWGLSKSIRAGVSELCNEHGKAIVIEDDLVFHPSFLEFMNEGLNRYENDPKVMEVSGYNYPVTIQAPEDAFFICHASCWGWGTWKRAWDRFDASDRLCGNLRADRALRKQFDMGGAYPYYELLEKQLAGEVDSWGIFWYQTLFEQSGLVLMPKKTLVCNRGVGEGSTHGGKHGYPDVMSDTEVKTFPRSDANSEALDRIAKYLGNRGRRSLVSRLRSLAFAKK